MGMRFPGRAWGCAGAWTRRVAAGCGQTRDTFRRAGGYDGDPWISRICGQPLWAKGLPA